MSHSGQIRRVWATLNTMMRDRGGDAALAVAATAADTVDTVALPAASPLPTWALSGDDVVAMAAGRSVFHVDLPGGTTFHRVIFDLLPRFKVADIRKTLQEAKLQSQAQVQSQAQAQSQKRSSPFRRAVVILVLNDKPNAAIVKGIMAVAAAAPATAPAVAAPAAPAATTAPAPATTELEVQLFEIKELLVDISKHMWVPLHEPIRDEASITQILRKYKVTTRYNFPLIMTTDRMARHLALRHGELVRITRTSPSAGTYMLYRCCMRA